MKSNNIIAKMSGDINKNMHTNVIHGLHRLTSPNENTSKELNAIQTCTDSCLSASNDLIKWESENL